MKDNYGRKIQYLRLSVTDRCNFRCIYCMPPTGICKKSHDEMLTLEELTEIARAAHTLGIKKIRLTGGEPLVRKGIVSLCRGIREIDSAIELGITTNGALLAPMAKELKAAGVDRINISLDSLNPETFRRITRGGELQDVFDGIHAAQEAGFTDLKINTVMLGGINDEEILSFIRLTKDKPIHLRFIELMPIGVAKYWDASRFMTVRSIEKHLQHAALIAIDGVARVYKFDGYAGTIGVICPMSHSFCPICNKIRVTPDGRLKPCLYSDQEINIKGLSGDALVQAIREGIRQKPESHRFGEADCASMRPMNRIGG